MLNELIWQRPNSGLIWLKIALVAGVLCLSYIFHQNERLWLAALGALVVMLPLLRTPELGPLAIMVGGLAVPFTIGTGTQTPIHAAVILIPFVFVTWVMKLFRERDARLVSSPVNLPAILFCVSVTVSLIFGNLTLNYFATLASLQSQLGGWAIFILSVFILLATGNLLREIKWLKGLTWLFLGLVTIYIALRWLAPGRLSSLFPTGMDGSLFWIWSVAMAGGQALFNRSLPGWLRALLFALVFAILSNAWILGRAWVSGWLPALAVFAMLLWLRDWRLGLFLTLAVAMVVLVREPNLIPSLLGTKAYSADTRLAAYEIMVNHIIPNSPIFGLGPSNYYFYTPLYTISGFTVNFNSHQQYLDIIAQTGFVGLGVFAWLMSTLGVLGWKLRRGLQDGFSSAYVCSCLAGLAASLAAGMLGDWFIPFTYNVGLAGFRASLLGWLFLGGLIAIENIVKRQTSAPSPL